jgi:hypothetical protein
MNQEYRDGYINGRIEDCPHMSSSVAARSWVCGVIAHSMGLGINYKCKASRGHTMKISSLDNTWIVDFKNDEKKPAVTRV